MQVFLGEVVRGEKDLAVAAGKYLLVQVVILNPMFAHSLYPRPRSVLDPTQNIQVCNRYGSLSDGCSLRAKIQTEKKSIRDTFRQV